MDAGRWVLLAAVVAALAVGGWRLVSDGRFRGTHRIRAGDGTTDQGAPVDSVLAGTSYDGERGQRATLLQFSSAFCAPCRVARRVLADVAGTVPGVAHVEVDAEAHLDLVRRLGVARTPTTLVLDGEGRELTRASGAPTRQQVLAALEASL